MKRRALPLILALVLALGPAVGGVSAQEAAEPAVLVADDLTLPNKDVIIATGNVEALFEGQRLTASKITFNQTTNHMVIEGPIRLDDGESVIVIARSAELDQEFRNGLIRGARMVLDEQFQLAAMQINRKDGRYSQFSRVAASSCQVCDNGRPPLWQIRASKVVHDQLEKQLYFHNAQFRVLDVPLFYMPRIRLPDPTLKRATGFLVPRLKSSTQLGLGLKMPYFITLGDHADLTLTPYASAVTKTLEMRYRRAFAHGDLSFTGAISRDTIRRDETRGYVFGEGHFTLPRDYRLDFDIETTTDDGYLAEYGYSTKDRLDSAITISRARRDEMVSAGLIHYESLRDGENNATQPTIIGDISYEKRFFPARMGGELRFGLDVHSHFRYSDLDVVGRDVSRASAQVSWRNRYTLAGGLRAGVEAGLRADGFHVMQDSTSTRETGAFTPSVSVELRWPLLRQGARARHLLEPMVQLGWVGGQDAKLPNDESNWVEFDEANLLDASRFPAPDRMERGLAAAYGLRYQRVGNGGWTTALAFGQVLRENPEDDFTLSSGLRGTRSDWLFAARVANSKGLSLASRALLDEDASVTKAEARIAWGNAKGNLGATYAYMPKDLAEDRDRSIAEWTLNGGYNISNHWRSNAHWRYDLASDRTAQAGLGVVYQNECVEVNFSVSRRYATSSNITPSTDFGLTVALKGFSTGGSAKSNRRTCRN